jgi:predicted alpha/beta hydrolase family esterase
MPAVTVLVLPGYADSGPDHWQSRWERRHGYVRVQQRDWVSPERDEWVRSLERAIAAAAGPVVLVAHSLGCALVAHWAAACATERVTGGLLVAPPDVDEVRHLLPEIESFAPMPMRLLPFRTVVVTSATDPYIEPPRARAFATAWGARLVEIAGGGHLNAESNLGDWPDGHRLLAELLDHAVT